jgi:GxxExxY protein
MMRVPSTLSEGLEDVIRRTIGCCIAVHRTLGPGLLESIYVRALCIELDHAELTFETEKCCPVWYRGQLLARQRIDLVVGGQLVVEVKALERVAPVHHAQVISYLRASGLRAGLLVNFNEPVLKDGLRRVVL